MTNENSVSQPESREVRSTVMQNIRIQELIDDAEGWTPVSLSTESDNTLVWREADPRARTPQAIAAEIVNPNLYEKWLRAAVTDNHLFTYSVPEPGEVRTAYRPFGQYLQDASGKVDMEVQATKADPLWLKGVTWYFDQWFAMASEKREGGYDVRLSAHAAYTHLQEVFEVTHTA